MQPLIRSLGLCAALVLPGVVATSAQAAVIPQGTVIKVQLKQELSSKTARVGDPVHVQVADEDRSGLPHDAILIGHVTEVQRARDSRPGVLDLSFRLLQYGGVEQPVAGGLYSLDPSDTRQTASGRLVAKKSKNDKTKFIGYGALGGVVLGKLLNTSTIKGVLLGAAAGYIYGQTRKDKEKNRDVELKEGAEFGVRLNQRLALRTARAVR